MTQLELFRPAPPEGLKIYKLKRGDKRPDGFVFNKYKKEKKGDGSVVYRQQWYSPAAFQRAMERESKAKKIYNKIHAQKIKKQKQEWRKRNVQKVRLQKREWRKRNPESVRESKRRTHLKNPQAKSIRGKRHYQRHKDKILKRLKKYRDNPDVKEGIIKPRERRRKASLRAFLHSTKQGKPCFKCQGTFPPIALDWHHVRGDKTKPVALCDTKEKMLLEIQKCEILCANCHREVSTYERTKHGVSRDDKVSVYLHEIKKSTSCQDCGKRVHYSAIDFHHVGEKKFNLSNPPSDLQLVKDELAKCVIICAVCHRIRHEKLWNDKRSKVLSLPSKIQVQGAS